MMAGDLVQYFPHFMYGDNEIRIISGLLVFMCALTASHICVAYMLIKLTYVQ